MAVIENKANYKAISYVRLHRTGALIRELIVIKIRKVAFSRATFKTKSINISTQS
jgi:hypothetical protein